MATATATSKSTEPKKLYMTDTLTHLTDECLYDLIIKDFCVDKLKEKFCDLDTDDMTDKAYLNLADFTKILNEKYSRESYKMLLNEVYKELLIRTNGDKDKIDVITNKRWKIYQRINDCHLFKILKMIEEKYDFHLIEL